MAYAVRGLDPAPFAALFAAAESERSERLAKIVTATSDSGFPCRVSLTEARAGETLLLAHHVSHDVATPFRMAHAIYVREHAEPASVARDAMPEMLDRRTIGLRAFGAEGMLKKAVLARPGEGDAAVRALFEDEAIAYIHAHNAAYGCFLATVERSND